MVIIFCWPLGFPVADALPAGEKFPGRYFCHTDVPEITEQRLSDAWPNRGRKFVVHIDNSAPHRAKLRESCFKTLGLCEADHPPYSPDLAP
jgi:hypothetical protein